MTLATVGIPAFAGAVFGTSLSEVRIPKQSDWTEHGVVIESGKYGSWDTRFYGQDSTDETGQ